MGRRSARDQCSGAGRGYTYRAEKGELKVIRFDDPAKVETPVDQAAQIGPGDTIVVPERWF
ncbi:MAG: hypothetical protein WDN69_15975 [Aliidongia sp.]